MRYLPAPALVVQLPLTEGAYRQKEKLHNHDIDHLSALLYM